MDSPLVSVEWLRTNLARPELRLVDCRFTLGQPDAGRQRYEAGHLPGASYLDLERDLSAPRGPHTPRGPRSGRHPLPSPQALAARLGAVGIGNDSVVVAYDDAGGMYAGRLWWLLQWLGHDRAYVLDGGMKQWQAAGLPLTTDAPSHKANPFHPAMRPELMVDATQVRERNAKTVLIDSRSAERFAGHNEPIDPVAGHIPGAVNYDWTSALDAEGRFKSAAEQRMRLAKIPQDSDVIVYCGSGVSATGNLLALRLAGYGRLRLYAGSWSDWIADPDNPCAEPSGSAP